MTARAPADRHTRWVLHVDMDAFYASVEVKEQPALRGLPVVVGGSGRRGVVASASYEARVFGVRSAMPGSQARRLCPHIVFLRPRFEVYHSYSQRLHDIFRSFSPLVEGIGLDEAFLDVTGGRPLFGPPGEIAAQLHHRVNGDLGLACSVGGGPNKLVAKLASKAAKPKVGPGGPRPGTGTLVVAEADVLGFIWPLPVEALWGVGPAGGERLRKLGVTTVAELAALPESTLVGALGKAAGHLLHALAWGRDERPVAPEQSPKSIGHEETYPIDIVDREELHRRLVLMADSVASRVREQKLVARTVTLKLRYGDFATLTRSHTFPTPQTTGPSFWTAGAALLDGLELKGGVRLIGLSASGLLPAGSAPGQQLQLELGAEPSPDAPGGPDRPGEAGDSHCPSTGPAWARATDAVDAVRARFGAGAVRPATALDRAGPRRPYDKAPKPTPQGRQGL
jgi:DNA polymerase-4